MCVRVRVRVGVGVGRATAKYDVGGYLDELLSGTVIFLPIFDVCSFCSIAH